MSTKSDSARLTSLRMRFVTWRNRLFSSPRFQQRAAAFPLIRPITRARAERVFNLVAGFAYSQVLAACVEVGLLDLLARGAWTTADVRRVGPDGRSCSRALAARRSFPRACRSRGSGDMDAGQRRRGAPGQPGRAGHGPPSRAALCRSRRSSRAAAGRPANSDRAVRLLDLCPGQRHRRARQAGWTRARKPTLLRLQPIQR